MIAYALAVCTSQDYVSPWCDAAASEVTHPQIVCVCVSKQNLSPTCEKTNQKEKENKKQKTKNKKQKKIATAV